MPVDLIFSFNKFPVFVLDVCTVPKPNFDWVMIMELDQLTIKQSLNKSFLKVKPGRIEFDNFKEQLRHLLAKTDIHESEEFHKNLIIEFFKKTHYDQKYFINTKGRNDLVIHTGKDATSAVGVIIETKRPSNNSEMMRVDNLNVKAFHELILYYLRERVLNKNLELKYLIATNLHEWFVFDAAFFENNFYHSKKLLQQYSDFMEGRLSNSTTDFFYREIAAPFISNLQTKIQFTHIDISHLKKELRPENISSETKLVSLFKIFSPEHLLKLPFVNDSNTLDKSFYAELLHVIGLGETKSGSKKIIGRKGIDERNPAALLESSITQLEALGKIKQLNKPGAFGNTSSERLFNVALELSITWINRILFLKLLEGQLITYHKGDSSYAFLNSEKIKSFDDVDLLFFQVLAVSEAERTDDIKKIFPKVPYLNSSLFEPTELEQSSIFIGNLREEQKLPLLSSTVLKDTKGRRRKGDLNTLEYLLSFLDSYDFATEGSGDIQESNKSIINASVLGLIFEKINGYKDGAFFTPGYVTMYMSRENIRQTILQRFNREKNWNCQSISDLYNKIENIKEANEIINGLKICDPAVGSGHFLVSALNEIISVKYDLNILCDLDGRRLKEYAIEVVNDELIITDEDGDIFEYKPKSEKSQRVQEAIFHEKELIIENCLFGVDISANSVKICRLRLWIELLKSAYYNNRGVLETLPNIDINIKCGNSLISRFSLDADLKQSLKKSGRSLIEYRDAVSKYRTAKSKSEKWGLELIIADIKNDFRSEIFSSDKKVINHRNLSAELMTLTNQGLLFEATPREAQARRKKTKDLELKVAKLHKFIEEVKNNKIFENAFEWRFEFPEVLNDAGDYIGFDLIVGNPPYGVSIKGPEREHLVSTVGKVPDYEIYYLFIDRARGLLRDDGYLSYIIPNSLLFNVNAQSYRVELLKAWKFNEVLDCTQFNIFSDAVVKNVVLSMQLSPLADSVGYRPTANVTSFQDLIEVPRELLGSDIVKDNNHNWGLIFKLSKEVLGVTSHIKENSTRLELLFPKVSQGLIAYDKLKNQSEDTIKNRVFHFSNNPDGLYKKWLTGSDVTRYSESWAGQEYLDYCEGIANPRDPVFFVGKRILIREITNPRIFAAATEKELYHDPAVIVVLDSKSAEISIEALLAILNSRLATFYHFNTSPKATKGSFPKILVYDVNNFPLPLHIPKSVDESLKKLAGLMGDNETGLDDRQSIDEEIDRLVYDLYCLDAEQVAIINNTF